MNNDSNGQFDIIELPSKGLFYANGCSKVKIYHMTLIDEEVTLSPNLWASGDMLDKLLERKVFPVDETSPFVPVMKMLIGDRLALAIFLRVTMDSIYKIKVRDIAGEIFSHDFDLTTLNVKYAEAKPDDKFEFDFMLPESGKRITFRLLNGEDEREMRQVLVRFNNERSKKVLLLERSIMSIEGDRDKMQISNFVKKMKIKDANSLLKYIDEVTPSMDLNIEVEHPTKKGQIIKQMLELDADFFFLVG